MDNVTLTMNQDLQLQVAAVLDQGTAKVVNGAAAAVVYNPTTGAIEAMYSNPSFDPNPLVSENTKTENFAWNPNLTRRARPSSRAPTTRPAPPARASRW